MKSRYFTWTLASLQTCYTSVFSDDGDLDAEDGDGGDGGDGDGGGGGGGVGRHIIGSVRSSLRLDIDIENFKYEFFVLIHSIVFLLVQHRMYLRVIQFVSFGQSSS